MKKMENINVVSNFFSGTIKLVMNKISFQIHFSYCKSDGQIEIDMVFMNDKDFTDEYDKILDKEAIINLIKKNLPL